MKFHSEQFTPTTEEVREWTAFGRLRGGLALLDPYQRREAFDRWLASHEAAIRRDQIEKDAQIADSRHDVGWEGHELMTARFPDDGKRIAAALRAQIGDTDHEAHEWCDPRLGCIGDTDPASGNSEEGCRG